jgi:fructose/tagatose bisphosphate aldolase
MPIVTEKEQVKEIFKNAEAKKTSIGIFCTASHWNTEAILIAAKRVAEKYNIKNIPVVAAMTFTYRHMPQAKRVTRSRDPVAGFISNMEHLKALCAPGSPYENVLVMPHLDHGDPVHDRWALTEGLPYLASVMFDTQRFSYEENLRLTKEYMEEYGDKVCVEGIIEVLSVQGSAKAGQYDDYVDKAVNYISQTGVDFLVADLGTEQQSSSIGGCKYLKDRAINITRTLGKAMLVLHGTSCLDEEQIKGLASDGVIRVNMWTRIAREAGQYAAKRLFNRSDAIKEGDFNATESMQYIYDNIDKAAEIM